MSKPQGVPSVIGTTVVSRRTLSLVVALMLVIATLAATIQPAEAKKKADPPGQLIELQLLGFNDYHGHLEATGNGSVGDVMNASSD